MNEHQATLARRWGRRLAVAAGALLLLWLLAWALVPPLLKWQGQTRLTQAVGREVRIGSVDFRPWALRLTVNDVSVAGASGSPDATAQLSVARLTIDVTAQSLLRFAPVIEALEVEAPRVRVARLSEGHYDIDDVLQRFTPSPQPQPESKGPQRFALYNLQVRDAAIVFDDKPVARRHEIKDALLTLPFLSDLPSQVDIKAEPRLAFTLNGTRFDTGATTTPFARARTTQLQLRTGEIDLAPWRPYLPKGLPVDLQRGRLKTDLGVHFALRDDGTPQLTLSGELQASDWAIAATGGAPLAAWRSVRIKLDDVQPLARQVALGAVEVEGLAISAPPEAAADARTVPAGAGSMQSNDKAGSAPPWRVSVASLGLKDSQFARGSDAWGAALGKVEVQQLAFESAADENAKVSVKRLNVSDLAVKAASARDKTQRPDNTAHEAQGFKELELNDLQIDTAAHEVALAGAKLAQALVGAERAQDGSLAVAGWPLEKGGSPAPAKPVAGTPWRVVVHSVDLTDADLRWRDVRPAAGSRGAASVRLKGVNASLRELDWPAGKPAELRLAAQVVDAGAGRDARAGSLDWQGRIAPDPFALTGALRIERFPAHALEPYFGDGLNVAVMHAEAGWRGDVAVRMRPEGMEASLRGNALVARLKVNGRDVTTGAPGSEELLSWQALTLRAVNVAVSPGARPRIDVGEARVGELYSRLVVSEQGRFNLRDATAPEGAASAPPGGFAVNKPAPAASAASQPETSTEPLPVDVSIGGVKLINGRIDYSDRFVRPNYSATLTGLNGSMGAFSTRSREMAALELRGKMAGTADLEIRGSLNPMVSPPAMDIGARATDLELAPLSPYAGKYAGYAIERGKLSMDVHYTVHEDGQLQASNHVVLNQLTFGDKIDSPDATKLPVLLAVALLKDRNGVIDVNLPVNGSLKDPQFSVGGIIVKVIINLIAKAITAPFSLLFGGSGTEDLSTVDFVPGTTTIAESSRPALEKVAKALNERPALKMTVTGASDPVSEREAMQSAQLEQRLVAEKGRELLRAGSAASAPASVSGDERLRLLKAVYAATDMPDKPRNLIGLSKDLPPAEMEKLLRSHMVVTADTARELALQRGIAVREALVAQGLSSERLFLAAPELRPQGEEGGTWSPRVKLVLSTR